MAESFKFFVFPTVLPIDFGIPKFDFIGCF